VTLDVPLARFTRHVPRFRGWHRMLEPLRRHYARVYRGRPDRWVVIDDFEGDLRLRLDRSAHIGSAIYWRGIHSFAEASILRGIVRPDDVVLDVGANQGELTLIAARQARSGRVFAFEPVPEWLALLTENVRMNRLDHVTPVGVALSDRESEVEMFTADDAGSLNEGLSSLRESAQRSRSAGRVRTLPLDVFVQREGLSRVDLVKIDVEGGEAAVIEGGRATLERFHPSLILEWNEPASAEANGLASWLRARGYALFVVDPFGRRTPLAENAPVRWPTVFARHASRV
jgi:FkbM family methyltransferase